MLTVCSVISRPVKLLVSLVVVIMTGLGSRMIHSGILLIDKYLGDALYAIMIYLILALAWNTSPRRRAALALMIMTVLEAFQLTLIPLEMTKSGNILMKIVGRLLGTTFSWMDLTAYLVGITVVCLVDRRCFRES